MGVCAALLYRFSAESLLIKERKRYFGKNVGKKDGKLGGRRTHDSSATMFLEKAARANMVYLYRKF